MLKLLPTLLVSATVLPLLCGPAAAQDDFGPITANDTLQAVDPDYPQDQPADGNARGEPGAEGASPTAEDPRRASELAVLQGKVAALESRVEQLEEMIRWMAQAGLGGPGSAGGPGAADGKTPTDARLGITRLDPAVAETSVTEAEVQRSNARQRLEDAKQEETAEEFDEMEEERRREAQQKIRNRLDDDGYGGGHHTPGY